jgi:hypothetical protein
MIGVSGKGVNRNQRRAIQEEKLKRYTPYCFSKSAERIESKSVTEEFALPRCEAGTVKSAEDVETTALSGLAFAFAWGKSAQLIDGTRLRGCARSEFARAWERNGLRGEFHGE